MTPSTAATSDPEAPVTTEVAEATVGRTLSLSATVTQEMQPLGTNVLTGIVTSTPDLSAVESGDTLYVVGGVPVRAVAGGTPFWRDLNQDLSGPDVRQLQQVLFDLGYLRSAPDGVFGSGTDGAVRAWQRDLGIEATGSVPLGEMVAIVNLPGPLVLGEDVRAGALLGGGEVAVLGVSGERAFALVVSEEQERLIPSDAVIRVMDGEHGWDARIVSTEIGENGDVALALAAADGSGVCGDQCDALPVVERLTLRADVVIIPEVTGPGVPASAVRTSAGGQAYVLDTAGRQVPVTVVGTSEGIAVVDGLAVGQRIVVTGTPDVVDGS